MKRKLMRMWVSLILGMWACVPAVVYGGEPGVPDVRVPSLRGEVVVDGKLDERAWKRAARLRMVDNENGRTPPVRTGVYLLHDGDFLYVGFECEDDERVLATMMTRDDNLWREEAVEIFIDPSGTGEEYLEVEVNPLATVYDAWIRFGSNIDFDKAKAFDLRDLKASTRVRRGGWTCEIAIPLTELPAPISPDARINLTRIDRIKGKHIYYAWSPTFRWFHAPERFGYIQLH